jgi:hypothetical protein
MTAGSWAAGKLEAAMDRSWLGGEVEARQNESWAVDGDANEAEGAGGWIRFDIFFILCLLDPLRPQAQSHQILARESAKKPAKQKHRQENWRAFDTKLPCVHICDREIV